MNQMNLNIMAIDPGASGGIATYVPPFKSSPSIVQTIAMPDDVEQCKCIQEFSTAPGERVCYMELVGGYIPDKDGNGQPGSAMFNFGDGYGFIRGLLAAFKVKLVLVRPQKWQIGIPGAAQKDAAKKRALKEHAARCFPQLDNVTLKTADALCILDYAMRDLKQDMRAPLKPINDRVESEKLSRFVAIVDLPLKEQYNLAEQWAAKTYGGQSVPKRRTKQWGLMFDYWLANIAPQ